MLAGGLIAWLGAPMCFAINAVSYVAVLAAFAGLHLPAFIPAAVRPSLFRHMWEGFRYVQRSVPIRECMLLLASISFFGQSYSVLTPVFATEVLHGGAFTQGMLTGANGLGALLGALYLARRRTVLGLGRVMAASGCLFGTTLLGFAWSGLLWLDLVLLVLAGIGMVVVMAGCNTIVQTVADEPVRGRVMSLYTMAFAGSMPLGSLVAGAVAARLGAVWTVTLGALCILAIVGQFTWRLPRIWTRTKPIYRRLGILPPEDGAA
jgi:MFS family permease